MTLPAGAGVVIRWALFAAVLLQTGAAAFRFLVLGRLRWAGPAGETLRAMLAGRAAQLARLGAMLGVLAVLGRLAGQASELEYALVGADTAALLRDTAWGRLWIAQLVVMFVAIPAWGRARLDERGAWRMGAGIALLLAISLGLTGHAAAHDTPALAVSTIVLHVLAAGTWLGAMVALFAGIGIAIRHAAAGAASTDTQDQLAISLVAGFSPMALAAAGLAALTGLVSSWLYLGGLSDLWQSRYGRILILKIGAVLLMAGLGAWNWRVATPALRQSGVATPIRRSLALELVAGALVLFATAVLVATPEPGQE